MVMCKGVSMMMGFGVKVVSKWIKTTGMIVVERRRSTTGRDDVHGYVRMG